MSAKLPVEIKDAVLTPVSKLPEGPVSTKGPMLKGIKNAMWDGFGGGYAIQKRSSDEERAFACSLGTRVHDEIDRTCKNFYRESETDIFSFDVAFEMMNDWPVSAHPMTTQFFSLLKEWRLRPISTEIPLAWNRFGTRCDVLVINERNLFVKNSLTLISVKTGPRRSPDSTRKTKPRALPKGFEKMIRCERIHDEAQLATEMMMYEHMGCKIDGALVVELPAGVVRMLPAFWKTTQAVTDLKAFLTLWFDSRHVKRRVSSVEF